MKITLTDPRTSVTLQPRNFTVTLSGARGPAGQGLPAGGAEGQIIVKQSAADYDTAWADNYATNVELYVKNSTAGAMIKGQVVYVSGADGTNPTVTLAQATSEGGSSKTIGVLKQDLTVGASGYVITDGLLEGLNTNSASAAGDTIWLSPTTAGGVVYGTANKPSAPNHMVFIGYVLRKNTNNGKIFVKIQNGFELQELHNVAISSPVTGQVLRYNSTTGLWSNDTDSGGINTLNGLTTSSQSFATGTSGTDFGIVSATGTHTFNLPTASASARGLLSSADWSTFNSKQSALSFDSTPTNGSTNPVTSDGVFDALALKQDALTNPVTGTGTSGQVAYFNGTSAVTGSANLFWNSSTNRLGVGTNSPGSRLDVISSTDIPVRINTSGNIEVAQFFGTGTAGNTTYAGFRVITSTNGVPYIGLNTSANVSSFDIGNQRAFFAYWGDSMAVASLGYGSSGHVLQYSTSNGNVIIGIPTITTPSARLHVRGSGTTSSTTALLVQNWTPSTLFEVKDNGNANFGTGMYWDNANSRLGIGTSTPERPLHVQGAAVFKSGLISTSITCEVSTFSFLSGSTRMSTTINAPDYYIWHITNGTQTRTSGAYGTFITQHQFSVASGTSTYTAIELNNTINQTGGANGITRGLYVNPTLTAAADWRSIETSNNTGYAAYFAGTADLFFNNGTDLQFGTGTGTKIGTSNTQKLSFWNATPVAQPTTAIAEATFTENSGGTAVNVDSTFAGYTLQQIAQALKDIGILQ